MIRGFQALSNGYRFPPYKVVLCTQAVRLRKALSPTSSGTEILGTRKDFRREIESIAGYQRQPHHAEMRRVYARWQAGLMAESIFEQETNTYLRLIAEDLPAMLLKSDEEL
jgi:hypothetical protein